MVDGSNILRIVNAVLSICHDRLDVFLVIFPAEVLELAYNNLSVHPKP